MKYNKAMNTVTCGQHATMSASERVLAASAGYRDCYAKKTDTTQVYNMHIPMVKNKSTDYEYMQEAIDEQAKCEVSPRVGAIAVCEGVVKARAHKTGNKISLHAERLLLDELIGKNIDPSTCTIYVTMEPCSGDNSCSAKIIENKVKSVVIGRYDLNSSHYRKGWKNMNENGISLRDFDCDLRETILENNSESEIHFMTKTGPESHGKFPYKHNGNDSVFELKFSETDPRKILLMGSSMSPTAIQVLCLDGATSLAIGASEFNQIDDPTALDLNVGSWQRVEKGEIAVLCNKDGCALLKVKEVNKADSSFNFDFKVYPAL